MNKILRRLTIVLLTLGAFLSTLSHLSNVSVADILSEPESVQAKKYKPNNFRDIVLEKEFLNSVVGLQNGQNKKPTTVEESVDVQRLKSKKVQATGYTAGAGSTGEAPDHPLYVMTD